MFLFSPIILAAATLAATNTAPIRTVADALKLSAFDGLGPYPFTLEGQVYSTYHSLVRDFKDATGGYSYEDHRNGGPNPLIGDIVRISGEIVITPEDLPRLKVNHLEILGHTPLPAPIDLTDANVDDPCIAYAFVRARGVITAVVQDDLDTRCRRMILRMQNRYIEIATSCKEIPHKRQRALLDAEVEVIGLFQRKSGWRINTGMHLLLRKNGNGSLKVIKPPPDDPFSVPELHEANATHRRRISGRVVAADRRRFFMCTRTGRFMEVQVAEESTVPQSGDCIETSGFTEMDPFHVRLSEAIVRPTNGRFPLPPPPQDIDLALLFSRPGDSAGPDIVGANTAIHGRLIRFSGKVSDLLDGTVPNTFFVQDGHRNVSVDLSGLAEKPSPPDAGSQVEITGLCLSEFKDDVSHRSIPRFRRYVILPRTASDIRILAAPPWWTPARLLLVIAILAIVLLVVLVWNRTLRILSERRGRQLYREQLGHVLAEKKTEERGRLAVELHDSISQTLTGVALQVDAACQADNHRPGSARPYLDAAKMLLASCRHELRCCIWDLRSRTFEEKNLNEAIIRTVRPHTGNIDLDVRFDAPRHELSESTIHTILRVARELSSNAVRHGEATRITISGECRDGTLRFTVEDNGCGFDPSRAVGAKEGHFGLQGIRERLKAANGMLTIESSPGGGTRATVVLEAPELKKEAT